jgi:hypothetical protein
MPEHPGYWLAQTRLNPEQAILGAMDLFIIPEAEEVNLDSGDLLDQAVYVHFHAGTYSFWAAAVDWTTGTFTGYSRNSLTGPVGRWGQCTLEVLCGIRIPVLIEGQLQKVRLQRDAVFQPQQLRDALRVDRQE